ncbi:MAG: aminopeptidase [Gemmatimonadetes bacterium]|nr:aminopeptidase [Gemmatimonadota bacterium]
MKTSNAGARGLPVEAVGAQRTRTHPRIARAEAGPGRTGRLTATLLLLPLVSACSPLYVLRAGYHEARILAARRPIPKVIADPKTDEATRHKLRLALAARQFARDPLGLDADGSYTTFVRLNRDTLALILSGAQRDRLEPVTWWFPIVGRVPYRGYFGVKEALAAEEKLQEKGFDTYLRPTAAFSTLGWFGDPLLSTLLRYDDVGLVETIIHELTHNTLYLSGHTTFNESFATFVGNRGAIAFFCGGRHRGALDRAAPDGGDPERCQLARDRWADELRFSAFIDGVADELRGLYATQDMTREEKLGRRESVFAAARRRFVADVQPGFRASRYAWFLETPLNNATLLARIRYYHRLADFDAALTREDELPAAIERIVASARALARNDRDPFEALTAPDG